MPAGRPKGTRNSPEARARQSERSKRLWADPAWRAARLEELKVNQPKAVVAMKAKRIRPTDPVKRNLYRKMVDCGVPRAEILNELMRPV
jgi:hypothetical protein